MTKMILETTPKKVLAGRRNVALFAAVLSLGACVSSHESVDDPCDDPRAERNPETLRCECIPSAILNKRGTCVDDPNWSEEASVEDAEPDEPEEADGGVEGEEGVDASAGTDAADAKSFPIDAAMDADANDADAARESGVCVAAAEACNDLDDDCDGVVDNGVLRSLWYRDCDGDGYAAQGSTSTVACIMPPSTQGCVSWTMRAPSAGAVDCNDGNAAYHPGADFDVADIGTNGDLNCDGVVEKKWRFDAPELRLDSFRAAVGYKLCDIRAPNGTLLYPESFAAFVSRGQCPCFVEWDGSSIRWTNKDVACSFQTEDEVLPIQLKQLDATTCQPGETIFPAVQRCR